MTISIKEAKPLCTASEFELVQESFDDNAHQTPAAIRQKIGLARKLRDKYRDLAQRQRREARGKQEPQGARPAQGNDRTVLKQQLFEQTMLRFEDRLGSVEPATSSETDED